MFGLNLSDILIIAGLLLVIAAAIKGCISRKKKGCSCCDGNCGNCSKK